MTRMILIVDDSDINRKILCKALRGDYDILEAENGRDALAVMLDHSKELSAVLLDIVMPVMDGYEVLAAMRAHAELSSIPVIVTTANTQEGA